MSTWRRRQAAQAGTERRILRDVEKVAAVHVEDSLERHHEATRERVQVRQRRRRHRGDPVPAQGVLTLRGEADVRHHRDAGRDELLDDLLRKPRRQPVGPQHDLDVHARLAQDYVQEAIELAKHTENRRLLAHAYVWQGLTYCNRFFDDSESARDWYDQALTLSKGVHAEGGWDDLQTLKARARPMSGDVQRSS